MPSLEINGVTIPTNPDACIIGGGIAGAMTAMKLGQAGLSVVILEAGKRFAREGAMERMQRYLNGDDPWRTEHPERDVYSNIGEFDYQLNKTRVKAVGGSTMHWAGYTPRFLENDFRMRSQYGIADDWPISYAELEPFYSQAERELGVSGTPNNPFAAPRSADFPLPGFPFGYDDRFLVDAGARLGITFHNLPQARTSQSYGERPGCVTFSACRACPIRARYSGDIHIELAEATGHVVVVPEANVVRLETDDRGDTVRRAVFITPDGQAHTLSANIFVVAAHAVESSRLLLLSDGPGHSTGLANSSGLVGRYFMEHRSLHRIVELDHPLYPDRKGFATAFSQQFHDPASRGDGSGFMISGHSQSRTYRSFVQSLASSSGYWGESFAEELQARLGEEYGRHFLIRTSAEPMPSEENRVDLDPELKDSFGMPAPRLSYSLTDYERSAYTDGEAVISDLADAMNASSVGELGYHFGSHHAGTCRMGTDRRTSVVDRNLKAHDHANLYIVGSSNFVTLSLVNPTLTICALALRLGHHLSNEQRRGG